jgi:hypothetical protein
MTAPATAPIGPSTTAPDTAPKAASPARSPALAAEDISAKKAPHSRLSFSIVPLPSCANNTKLNQVASQRWFHAGNQAPN